MCGGMFNNRTTATYTQSVQVKKLNIGQNLTKICQSQSGTFLVTSCTSSSADRNT